MDVLTRPESSTSPSAAPKGRSAVASTRTKKSKEDAVHARQEESGGQGQDQGPRRQAPQARHRRRTQERLTALIAPWWEQDPAALKSELASLKAAGFVPHQELGDGHRLKLRIDHDGRRYELVFDDDYLLGGSVLAYRIDADGEPRGGLASQPGPDRAVDVANDLLLQRTKAITPRLGDAVVVPVGWFYPGNGESGRLMLGATPLGTAIAAVGLTGVEHAAPLTAMGSALMRAFPVALNGLWARGEWLDADANSPEVLVASVEEQLAEAHQLPINTVRERLRTEIGGVIDQGIFQFVRRSSRGEPIVLRTLSHYDSPFPERAPFAAALMPKRVVVIGCGAVGWTLAILLARSGVRQFTLFDDDRIQTTNLSRLGGFLGSAGAFKVDALAEQLEAVAPGVEVRSVPHLVGRRVGALALIDAKPDLLLNLTGEEISTDETNRAALVLGKPAIFAWVSNGVAAGRILRVRPFDSACYECVRDSEPEPINSRGPVPVGDELPWTGSVVDVEAFAAAVAHVAVRTLLGDGVSAANPDHLVLDFAGLVPTTATVVVERDATCAECAA
jgi:molybdopterin/thiamine biosynthesis adenylyltransferase